MNDIYSPHTGEHIDTDDPAEWMLHAGIEAPAYNKQTAGCYWRGGAWVVEQAPPPDPKIPLYAALEAADAPFTPRRQREFMRVVLERQANVTAELAKIVAAQAANPAAGVDLVGLVAVVMGEPAIDLNVLKAQTVETVQAANPTYQIVKAYDDAAADARAQLQLLL